MGRIGTEPHTEAIAVEYSLPWGAIVRGQRWGPPPDRIIVVHEPGGDLDRWGPLPARLAQELMIGVASFDLPGHGLSDDPWEPARTGGVLRALVERAELPFRQVLITAGLTGGAALEIVPDLQHIALVCLSPKSSRDAATPARSNETPKLFFAGALAGGELDNTRALAVACGGWSNVTSLPVEESGTALLTTPWSDQIQERIVSFARDFLGLRTPNRRLLTTVRDTVAEADGPGR